jgi:hypothetical protein
LPSHPSPSLFSPAVSAAPPRIAPAAVPSQ